MRLASGEEQYGEPWKERNDSRRDQDCGWDGKGRYCCIWIIGWWRDAGALVPGSEALDDL